MSKDDQSSRYYEATCGNCGAVLYSTTKGIYWKEVKCPHCTADNIFADSIALHGDRSRGQVADASRGTARTSQSAVASGR